MNQTEKDPKESGPITASVERLRQELDRWLEIAVDTGGKAMDKMGIKPPKRSWMPAADIVETSEDVLVYMDLPGIDPTSLEIVLVGNMLTISGDKRRPIFNETDKLLSSEREIGPFVRSIPLPVQVNPESVNASARNGVLSVRMSKSVQNRSHKIHVQVDG